MKKALLNQGSLNISIDEEKACLHFSCPEWESFSLGPLSPSICVNGRILPAQRLETERKTRKKTALVKFAFPGDFRMELVFERISHDAITMKSRIRNLSNKHVTLQQISLLKSKSRSRTGLTLGKVKTTWI